jgi:phosphoribosyl 1,2-cyclic phosphodiesterase
VTGAELALLEANHDVATLRCGPYPYPLQQRILGPFGHLSNEASGKLAVLLAQAGCRGLLLAHLSKENNTPGLAYETVSAALRQGGFEPGALRLCVAPPDSMSEMMEI